MKATIETETQPPVRCEDGLCLILENPRDCVNSAQIYAPIGDRVVWLSVQTRFGEKQACCNSVTAAKSLFSTHVLSPRWHGKNKWAVRHNGEVRRGGSRLLN